MNRLSRISFLVAILSLTISIYGQTQIHNNKKIEVAGVIRCTDGKGWFAINDENHASINIEAIRVKDGAILLFFSFSATTIHSFIVTPDEIFAQAGFLVGATVRPNLAVIHISRIINGNVVPVDASTIRSELGDFWIYGLFS